MNKLYVLFLLLAALLSTPLTSRAQLSGADSLRQRLNTIFAPLDKSQVPTAYLEEYGVRLLPLHPYNGTLTDSNRTTLATLRYLRASLQSARIFGADTLPTVPALNARLRAALATASGAIPLAMQYMPYASIRPEALQNNLLSVQNEQVYDVAGRSQSPYQTNVLFAAAPARLDAPTNSVSFVFRRNLFLSGDGRSPSSLALDFGDGNGYHTATWGQPLGTTYATGGAKRIKVRLQFGFLAMDDALGIAPAETRESWFDFIVPDPTTAARYGSNGGFDYPMSVTSSHYSAHINNRVEWAQS